MEVRELLERVNDPEIKQTLTKLAESYHKLVEEVDRIADLKGKLQAVRDLEKLE